MTDVQTVHDLDTPSVLVDLAIMERNIQRMQALCDEHGVAFRAHVKTHKIPAIARMQIEAGAIGIACQKVSEAEVFAAAGLNDILIPYNIVGPLKTRRLTDLALYNRITVSADSRETIAGLSAASEAAGLRLRVLVELETDQRRAGAPPERAVELAQQIEADEHLHFAGLLLYPSDPAARPAVQYVLDRLDEAGIGVDLISGGGTGAVLHLGEFPELTEIRVGTYVFNDWTTVLNGWCALDDCAMAVRSTVVSRPNDDRGILDAGSKTLTPETIDGGYGYLVEYPQARIYRLNEEHAYVDFSACPDRPDVGDIVHIIPVHTCVTTNMHDQIYGVRGGWRDGAVEQIWPVAARGKVW
ncbi:MAG: alanine racemase [Candidatus Flexifilum sp.]